jgi:effector-binding domain-containing protein
MTITYEITDQLLTNQHTVVVRGEIEPRYMPAWLAAAYRDVGQFLHRAQVHPTGPPFARFTFMRDVVAVEAGFPVPHELGGEDPVEPSRLPGGPAAVTTHIGRYEDLTLAYEAVHRWLGERGFSPAGPHWEVYFTDPNVEPDPSRWRTDVVVPYRTR